MKISNTIYILYIHIHTYIYIYKYIYIYIYIYTDEVVIEFFEKEMKEKLSANDIDKSHPIDKPEVDLGLLSSSLPSTMPVMLFLEKRRFWKVRLLV